MSLLHVSTMRASAMLLSISLLFVAIQQCGCQVSMPQWPFEGQGYLPDSEPRRIITVDLHLEKIAYLNEHQQSWRAVHWFHLTWQDPTALTAIENASQAWADAVLKKGDKARTSTACTRACDSSFYIEAGCCDQIWLPHIDLPNCLEYSTQNTPPRWRIWVTPTPNSSSYTVHWSVRVDALWFSPFDFRAWPLEHQHLTLEIQPSTTIADRVALKLGDTSSILDAPHTKGQDAPGWYIDQVFLRVFDTSACYKRDNTTTYTVSIDPATGTVGMRAIGPSDWFEVEDSHLKPTVVAAEDCILANGNAEAMAQYGPRVIVFDMMIKRYRTYYVCIFILPLILVNLMVFVVYAMERSNLEARATVVMTLVLSVCALQFMYSFPPAGYLNAVQQLTITSFVLMSMVAVECMITSSIARLHERARRYSTALTVAGYTPKESGFVRMFARKRQPSDIPDAAALSAAESLDAPNYTPNKDSLDSARGAVKRNFKTGVRDSVDSIRDVEMDIHPTAAPGADPHSDLGSNGSTELILAEGQQLSGDSSKPAKRRFTRWPQLSLQTIREVAKQGYDMGVKISADEAYAQLVARRIDVTFCIVLLTLYIIVVITLLAICQQVGDHKLMLSGQSKPGNM